MKRYITYDACDGEFNLHSTIEEAREYLRYAFFCEAYHPETANCQIFELKEVAKVEVTDKKSNYEYEEEEDIPEGADGEAWPYGSDIEELWDVKFVEAKEGAECATTNGVMNEIFDIIDELRVKIESCRRQDNGTKIGDIIQEINKLDNKLIRNWELGHTKKEDPK